MIKTVSDLLDAFLERERAILDRDTTRHPPTIGAMYEGLTREALTRTLPVDNLRVTSGFAVDAEGTVSRQLDCILAVGDGEPVPYTDSRRYFVEDILATVEVKKTLYAGDLADGFENLKSVYERMVRPGTPVPPVARRAFELITGTFANNEAEVPEELKVLWHVLRIEAASPARILLGFHGYKSESALRRGVLEMCEGLVGVAGTGPMSFPHLIANEHAVVLKANGMPWPGVMEDDKWPFLLSSDTMTLGSAFLEIVWSRLNYRGHATSDVFGLDLDVDCFHRLLDARCVGRGWEFHLWRASVPEEVRGIHSSPWEPVQLDDTSGQLVFCLQQLDELNLTALPHGYPPREQLEPVLRELRRVGLVVHDASGQRYRLATGVEMVFMPDGRVVAGDNSSGRLAAWISTIQGRTE